MPKDTELNKEIADLIIKSEISKATKLLNKHPEFKTLCMSKLASGFDNVLAIAKIIEINETLEEVDLTDSSFSPLGVTYLMKALAKNSSIKKFTIDETDLGIDGGKKISTVLTENKTLEVLSLGFCGIDDEGALSLLEALRENSTLKSLNLHENDGISDEVIKYLYKVAGSKKDFELITGSLIEPPISPISSSPVSSLDSICSIGPIPEKESVKTTHL